MMQITMKREDLIEKLKQQISLAEVEDNRIAKVHKADEHKALSKFRAKCREAMKWTYEEAKIGNYTTRTISLDPPSCPVRYATRIKVILRLIEMSYSPRFSVREGSDIHAAVSWVPESKKPPRTVCE